MYSVRNMVFALLICAMAAAPLAAGEKPVPVVKTNVTSVVHDNDAAGNPLDFGSDDYTGAGQATYTSVLNVTSTLGIGWGLSLFNQTVRTVHLTFEHLSGGTAPLPPSGYYWQNVEIYSACFDANGNTIAFPGITSTTPNCSFGLDFTDTKVKYKLVMGPVETSGPTLPATGPTTTGWATVTCTSGTVPCVSWTIAPNAGTGGLGVANLYQFSRNGSLVFIGQYKNTFRIDVTNP